MTSAASATRGRARDTPESGQCSYGLTPSRAGTGSHAPTPALRENGDLCSSLTTACTPSPRHHTAHLSVFKQAPAVTTSHSGNTQAEVHAPGTCRLGGPPPPQRCAAASPQPLRGGARGAGRQGRSPHPERSAGDKRRPQPSPLLSVGGSVWGRAQGGPRRAGCGRTRTPHEAARPKQRLGTAGPARNATSPRSAPSQRCSAPHARPGSHAPPQPNGANLLRQREWRRNPIALAPRYPDTLALIVSLYGHQNV